MIQVKEVNAKNINVSYKNELDYIKQRYNSVREIHKLTGALIRKYDAIFRLRFAEAGILYGN